MTKYFTALLGFLGIIALSSLQLAQANTAPDAQPDAQKGERIFKTVCSACHGSKGDRSAMGKSRIIKDLSFDDVVSSLEIRKQEGGSTASRIAKSKLSEEDMKNIAAYLQTLQAEK